VYCKIKQYSGTVLRGEFGYRTGQVGTRLAGAKLGQKAKSRQKFELKNSWNWQVILIPATVWQVLSIKLIPGNGNRTETCWNLLGKTREIASTELILWGVIMNVLDRRASPIQGTVQYGSPVQAYTSLLSHVHSCCCEREVFPVQITFCRMCTSFAPSWFDGKYQWVQLLVLLWFQNLIIRRRKQQIKCRPLQIGSIFFVKKKPFLKQKTFFGWCNVKSDLSVTIINQKGKLIWAERGIKKNKKNYKSLFHAADV
jgi:hypothetical protein